MTGTDPPDGGDGSGKKKFGQKLMDKFRKPKVRSMVSAQMSLCSSADHMIDQATTTAV